MRLSVFLEQSGSRISAHSAQLISAFGFALSARISHRTMSPGYALRVREPVTTVLIPNCWAKKTALQGPC